MQKSTQQAQSAEGRKKGNKRVNALVIVLCSIMLLLVTIAALYLLGVFHFSPNRFHAATSTAEDSVNTGTNTPQPHEAVVDEQALSAFRELLCSGEWYSVATIDTDIEIKGWKFEDIAPSWINVISFTKNGTFHQYSTPDLDVHGFDITDHYETGDILRTGSPMGYIEGENYKVDGIRYQLYMVYYFDEDGYLVEVIYLKEIGTDCFYLASNANLFELLEKRPDQ